MNIFKEFVVKVPLRFTIMTQPPCGEIIGQEVPGTKGIMLACSVSVYVRASVCDPSEHFHAQTQASESCFLIY